MKRLLYIVLMGCLFAGCSDLDQLPPNKLSPSNFFKSEKDLELYTYSFYNQLPSAKSIFAGDESSDYAARNNVSSYLSGNFTANDATGWAWSNLRNINYFLEHYNNPKVSLESRQHYGGIARLFRAMFYYNMLKKFGPVPWYGHTLSPEDPALFNPRDSRELVMDSILVDLDYACKHIRSVKDPTSSTVTKWVALAIKSRICLFEGTFLKYHEGLTSTDRSNKFLREAANSAKEIMDSQVYTIYKGSGRNSYKALFISENLISDEVIWGIVHNSGLKKWHDANWYYNSATYGVKLSLTKQFINTYLYLDGTAFTSKVGYDKMTFSDETVNRDWRLEQTIRCPEYKRNGIKLSPDFSIQNTGYQIIKYTLDNTDLDGKAENWNSIPYIRYAEVLLNYAEARAELGEFDANDWSQTIVLLRERAGIINSPFPSARDNYFFKTYFSKTSKAALLEIHRERGIELVCEGLRYDDLVRWKVANLMSSEKMPYYGMYVPAKNVLIDLNNDGKNDVCFVDNMPSKIVSGVIYFMLGDEYNARLTNGDSGYIEWLYNKKRVFEDKQYFYPIPTQQLQLNPHLKQNEGWEQ